MGEAVYWAVHNKLIHKLREIGIHHSFKDRLELAWYKHHIKKVTDKSVTDIIGLLDHCIQLRIEGLEPQHKNGRYL